ncbi:uncharacterized protein TNCV_371851 [Trichonephila clavipes]|nr:uncharacterized protein TNCV_371851 [Trichonephila clavipes]
MTHHPLVQGLVHWQPRSTSSYSRAFGYGPCNLNHGQVTWITPELAPPLLTTTPHHREDVSALDRFNVHRCPTRRVFSGTGLDLVTRHDTIRYLYHSATAETRRSGPAPFDPRTGTGSRTGFVDHWPSGQGQGLMTGVSGA